MNTCTVKVENSLGFTREYLVILEDHEMEEEFEIYKTWFFQQGSITWRFSFQIPVGSIRAQQEYFSISHGKIDNFWWEYLED